MTIFLCIPMNNPNHTTLPINGPLMDIKGQEVSWLLDHVLNGSCHVSHHYEEESSGVTSIIRSKFDDHDYILKREKTSANQMHP